MPSPDASPYVDLTLLDISAEQLADSAIDLLASRLVGWEPREAATEVMLIEVVAVLVAELVYAVNRVPGATLESLLRLYGEERSLGHPATAAADITVVDALGQTIPAGTRLRLELELGNDPITFATDVDLEVPPGSTSGTVAITAEVPSPNANGVAAGTSLLILDAVPALTAVLASSPVAGSGPEDGVTFLNRASARLRRLTDTLVLPDHFTARALELAEELIAPVYRARTIDLYDADTDTPDVPGHVTVAVRAPGGAELTGPQLTAVDVALEAQALASLSIHVINATVTEVDVTVDIAVLPDYTPIDVADAATQAITAYLNPDAWGWSDTVRVNELIALVDNILGVDYVIGVTLDGGTVDIVLPGPANLAAAGDVDVVVP